MYFNTTAHLTLFQSHLLGPAADPAVQTAFQACAPADHSGFTTRMRGTDYRLVERVIGMCLTGSLPLALLPSAEVRAAVLCQPTNPFLFSLSLDLSRADRESAANSKTDVLKFSNDSKSPEERWRTLRKLLKARLTELVIDSSAMNTHGIAHHAHSILAASYFPNSPTAEAFERVVRFLDARLSDGSSLAPFPAPGESETGRADHGQARTFYKNIHF